MNLLRINTVDETELQLNIPATLDEINFGQLIKLEEPGLTNYEAISILSGISLDEIYNAKSFEDYTDKVKMYTDMFLYSKKIFITELAEGLVKMPSKVIVSYAGKNKKVKIGRYISIVPSGAFLTADGIIFREICRHIDLYGEDKWKENFVPSLASCGALVDAFLYCRVTGKLWKSEGLEQLSIGMKATEVLAIAKHFFNSYPALNSSKPTSKLAVTWKMFLAHVKTLFSLPGVTYYPNGDRSELYK